MNSASREEVGDAQAVAMGSKEVEPVDFLVGTCLGGMPSGATPSSRPQMSRASGLDEWEISPTLAQKLNHGFTCRQIRFPRPNHRARMTDKLVP
jgi:hypothetical protein